MPSGRSTTTKHAKPAPAPKPDDPADIIILSSDDEGPSMPPVKRKKLAEAGFVEIPSGSTKSTAVKALELRMKKMENQRSQAQMAAENAKLKAELEAQRRKPISSRTNVSDLEESVSCEICTLKLWSPFMLTDCGHVFCQTCLEDWFSTILAQHLAVHPNYNVNHNVNFPGYQMAMFGQQQPKYSCPTCRELVSKRPAEDFVLKNIVRIVGKVEGEESPTKPTAAATRSKGKGKRSAIPVNEGPWDKFFRRP
ncbi:hypothetical protein C8J56DRAFT_1055331 [Mycena floridula]|nr:hypothetical protein C8J56DRAFT_1055331 [Mycena floridula]